MNTWLRHAQYVHKCAKTPCHSCLAMHAMMMMWSLLFILLTVSASSSALRFNSSLISADSFTFLVLRMCMRFSACGHANIQSMCVRTSISSAASFPYLHLGLVELTVVRATIRSSTVLLDFLRLTQRLQYPQSASQTRKNMAMCGERR